MFLQTFLIMSVICQSALKLDPQCQAGIFIQRPGLTVVISVLRVMHSVLQEVLSVTPVPAPVCPTLPAGRTINRDNSCFSNFCPFAKYAETLGCYSKSSNICQLTSILALVAPPANQVKFPFISGHYRRTGNWHI